MSHPCRGLIFYQIRAMHPTSGTVPERLAAKAGDASRAFYTSLGRGYLLALKQIAKGLQGVIQEAALGEAWRDLQDAVDHQ